jgi:hypothetical protein
MNDRLPLIAILLGIAGLIPFVGVALASFSPDPAQTTRMLTALIGYGAVILSFLGGVHWGFALAPGAIRSAPGVERTRLLLGVLPSLVGWVALLLPSVLPAWCGLLLLAAGFLATTIVEGQAARRALTPPGYLWMRWALSLVVIAILLTTLLLHALQVNVYF